MFDKEETTSCEIDILGKPNERCFVTADNDKVYKKYFSSFSYNNEKRAYELLTGQKFVPKIYEFNDKDKHIVMERIKGKSLHDQPLIPPTFVDDMLFIYDKLVEFGITDTTDLFKPEHIFIDPDNSSETHGVRIIDFDVYPPIEPDKPNYNMIINIAKNRRNNIIAEIHRMLLENGIDLP